jgi:putative ATP-dependent endonuclease of the OLD family
MRLEKVRIQNFRSFKDETVEFDAYTCLVGPNGCGKSTVLTALNVFFRNTASATTNVVSLSAEDFHHGNTKEPVCITLTFKDLSAEAQADLGYYYRQGRLIVTSKADWNEASNSADVKQYGIRDVMTAFVPYFKAAEQKQPAAQLKSIYDEIQSHFADLPKATSGPTREKALHDYEESHPELCSSVEAETQFFGFTKGSNLMDKYIQWVYVPAVKDASTEQQEGSKGALKDLLDRTIRSKVNFKEPIAALKKRLAEDYRKIVDAEKQSLSNLEASMHKRLREWANPGAMLTLGWYYDENKSIAITEPYARASIGEDNFIGEVARLGHGMQRSFLVALLHELASLNADQGPTLLLGFEEPELYQHPPQAQHMSNVLEDLANSAKTNTQVIVCTHSPYFVSTKGFENVRMVRKHPADKCSLVAATTYEKIEAIIAKALDAKPNLPSVTMARIEQIMQPSQKELYFSRVPLLVEGLEDVGYIATYLMLKGHWQDFRRLGCHFILTGGKTNMSRLLAIANELCIRAFAIIDGDTDKNNRDQQERDNLCILRLCGTADADPLPKENLFYSNCVVWSKDIAAAVHEDVGQAVWEEVSNRVRETKGFMRGSNNKNKLFVAGIIEELVQRKCHIPTLDKLCRIILEFAEPTQPTEPDVSPLSAIEAETLDVEVFP